MKHHAEDFALLLHHINLHVQLNTDEANALVDKVSLLKVGKKRFILREGEVCKYSSFVNSGCMRGYTVDGNGLEHILHFAPPGWWIADMYSLISRKPGILYIEAMEDTQVIQLSKDRQEELCKEVPKMEHYFRIITENALVSQQQRVTDSLSLSAEERYALFCKKYPQLIHSVSQKHIAAYLGVTPEFFSKMKKSLLRKT